LARGLRFEVYIKGSAEKAAFMAAIQTVETTLGELIEALTVEAGQVVRDEREANMLVAYILSDIFRKSEPTLESWH
jgi:chemotaxis methyl-accepting protein methylase